MADSVAQLSSFGEEDDGVTVFVGVFGADELVASYFCKVELVRVGMRTKLYCGDNGLVANSVSCGRLCSL